MNRDEFPAGWDEERVQRALAHYERQSEDEAIAEDEGTFEIDLIDLPPATPQAL